MKTPLKPIQSWQTKETFYDYIHSIDIPFIDYFAVAIQSAITRKSINLMSRPEWQEHFIKNELVEGDPVRNTVLCSKRKIILLSEIDTRDNFGREVMRQRSLYGVKNGIILVSRHVDINYMVTLGTAYSKFDPYQFLKKNFPTLKILQNDLEKIITPSQNELLI